MKKLLALFASAVLVLTFAAGSLARVATSCDFSYEWTQLSNADGADHTFDTADFRINFDGAVSQTVASHLTMRFNQTLKTGTSRSTVYADNFYTTVKLPFADLKVGAFDYRVHPSSNLAVAHEHIDNLSDTYDNYYDTHAIVVYDIFGVFGERNPTMLTAMVPLKGGLSGGFAYVIDASTVTVLSDDAYDLSLVYKGKNYGVEVHRYDAKVSPAHGTINRAWNFDVYYDRSAKFRIYAFGTTPEYDYKYKQFEDEVMVGLQFKNVFGTKLFAAFEYSVSDRTETTSGGIKRDWEQSPYGILLRYQCNNKVVWEWECFNTDYTNDVQNTLRFKFAF